jgi:pimeloyl-ACP methyl ester carboxylesterase
VLLAVVSALVLVAAAPAGAALPPDAQTVAVGGSQIAYRTTGTGAPLLLINGSGATLDTWDPALLAALAPGRRLIAFDPRGMAGSTGVTPTTVEAMADDAAALLGALRIARADILGWSLGGFVAQEVAIRHPALVRRLVLASSSPGGRNATSPAPKVLAIDEKTTIGSAAPDEFLPILFPSAAQKAGQDWIARLGAQPGSCCEVYSKTAGRHQVAAGRRWFAAAGGDERRLGRIRAPTLIGAGRLDVDIPPANARLLHREIRGSRLLTYPDAGHAFLIQHAAAFAAAVRRFLG